MLHIYRECQPVAGSVLMLEQFDFPIELLCEILDDFASQVLGYGTWIFDSNSIVLKYQLGGAVVQLGYFLDNLFVRNRFVRECVLDCIHGQLIND